MFYIIGETSPVEQIAPRYAQDIETFKSWGIEVMVVMCGLSLFLYWIKSVRGS